jgi:hypothetical protein
MWRAPPGMAYRRTTKGALYLVEWTHNLHGLRAVVSRHGCLDTQFFIRMSASICTLEGKVIGRLLAEQLSCTVVVADRNITTSMVNYSQIITASAAPQKTADARVLIGPRSVLRCALNSHLSHSIPPHFVSLPRNS